MVKNLYIWYLDVCKALGKQITKKNKTKQKKEMVDFFQVFSTDISCMKSDHCPVCTLVKYPEHLVQFLYRFMIRIRCDIACIVQMNYKAVLSCKTHLVYKFIFSSPGGGGAMVLGKLPVPGRPTTLDKSRARCGGDFFSLIFYFSFLSPSLWETV